MTERKRTYLAIAALSTALLLLSILTLVILQNKPTTLVQTQTQTVSVTEQHTVLVYVDKESISESEKSTEGFYSIAKRHGDKIGIFDRNQTLIQILDVQIKTLPKADRDLLEEGIELFSKKELNALIEDYTE